MAQQLQLLKPVVDFPLENLILVRNKSFTKPKIASSGGTLAEIDKKCWKYNIYETNNKNTT